MKTQINKGGRLDKDNKIYIYPDIVIFNDNSEYETNQAKLLEQGGVLTIIHDNNIQSVINLTPIDNSKNFKKKDR